MQRGGHQRAIAPGLGQSPQIFRIGHATARQQPHVRVSPAQAAQQLEIDSTTRSDPTHIEHQQGSYPGIHRR